MTHYFKDIAPSLFDNGYKPIPIKPRTKIPFMSKGESWQVDIDKAQVEEWAANGKGAGSIALTGLCGIDCDVKNKVVSNKLVKYIRANIGRKEMIRIGLPPKFLVPASPLSAIKKKHKNTWYDKSGEKHEIEFLSPGDQYFLAFGIHPDTGKPFSWVKDHSPINIAMADLTTWDELDISGLEDEFDRLATEADWTREKKQKSKGENPHHKAPKRVADPFTTMKGAGDMADKAGIAELKAWLSLLPSAWVNDRDNWITIGAAVHHETGGGNEGWLLFDQWSQGSNKYKGRKDTMDRWESFDQARGLKDGGGCSTRGTIIHVLKEAGIWKQAEKEGEAARETASNSQEREQSTGNASDLVEQMNQRHAVIKIGSKCRVMDESKAIDGGIDLGFLSVPDFKTMYSNKFAPDPKDPKKQKRLSDIWLVDQCRREYNGIVFDPSRLNVDGYYNLWKGFSIKPKKGDWRRFEDHIYNVIADGNETIGKWIIAWVARMVQDPGGRRPGTSIVMKGGQGTGKGVFANTVGDFFGRHYLPVSHASQVAGRFNSHLTNKLLVFIDEGFWAGDKQAEGVLKSIITELYMAIEQKGIDIIRVVNHINLIMASNNDWVVPANMQERRFCVLNVSSREQGHPEYFEKVMRQMYEENGLQAMLYDLLKMDISDIKLGTFEQTKGLYEQKIHSMSTEMQYWHERLQEGEILSFIEDESEFSNYVGESVLWGQVNRKKQHLDYLRFADQVKERYPLSPTQFGLFVKKICPEVRVFKKRIGEKLKWYREFPAIEECRKEFETQIKYQIDWELEDEEENLPF